MQITTLYEKLARVWIKRAGLTVMLIVLTLLFCLFTNYGYILQYVVTAESAMFSFMVQKIHHYYKMHVKSIRSSQHSPFGFHQLKMSLQLHLRANCHVTDGVVTTFGTPEIDSFLLVDRRMDVNKYIDSTGLASFHGVGLNTTILVAALAQNIHFAQKTGLINNQQHLNEIIKELTTLVNGLATIKHPITKQEL